MIRKAVVLTVAICAGFASAVCAANIAEDDAADPAYQPNFNDWQNGDNGGFGFATWGGLVDQYVGSSSANGDGGNNGAFTIDTSGDAWALRGDGATNGFGEAIRGLTGGSLEIGQSILLDFDNGFVNGGSVGFGYRSGGTNVFEFFYSPGGNNTYKVSGSSIQETTQGFTDDGMRTTFTLTSATSFTFLIDFASGIDQTLTGTLNPNSGIDNIRFFNFSTSGDPSGNAFYNNMAVIPEPSSFVVGGLALAACVYFRNRRRQAA